MNLVETRKYGWLPWVIVAAAVLFSGAVLAVGMLVFGSASRSLPIRHEDRAGMVLAIDVAEASGAPFRLRTEEETWTKRIHADGTLEIQYEYNHPEPDQPFLVRCRRFTDFAVEQKDDLVDECESQIGANWPDSVEHSAWETQYGVGSVHGRACDLLANGNVIGHAYLSATPEAVYFVEVYGRRFLSLDSFASLVSSRMLELPVGGPVP